MPAMVVPSGQVTRLSRANHRTADPLWEGRRLSRGELARPSSGTEFASPGVTLAPLPERH